MGWSLASASLAAGWMLVAYRRTAGTTLRAPVIWAAVALLAVLIVELRVGSSTGALADTARYLAAVGWFCPAMALLGAKRPQHRAWQCIVATLWLVLALPALQSLVFAPHAQLELHPAWSGFLGLLIGVTVTNYLPTRFALAAVFAGASQVALLAHHLPGVHRWGLDAASGTTAALALFAASTTTAGIHCCGAATALSPSNRVWRAFRDAYGVVWGLRVIERVNQAVRTESDSQPLSWHGFAATTDPLSPESDANTTLAVTLRMVLLRFVSADWIDRHR